MGAERVWLDSLKAGDKVILSKYGYGSSTNRVGFIVRRTKNFIIASAQDGAANYEYKFRCESGYEAGSGYYRSSLVEATQERLDAIHLDVARYHVRSLFENKIDWTKVPIETLQQLKGIGQAFIKEGKEAF